MVEVEAFPAAAVVVRQVVLVVLRERPRLQVLLVGLQTGPVRLPQARRVRLTLPLSEIVAIGEGATVPPARRLRLFSTCTMWSIAKANCSNA